MEARVIEYISIAKAYDQNELIRIQMLLDRSRLPYRLKGENLFQLMGQTAMGFVQPVEFIIPKNLVEEAERVLNAMFEVDLAELPEQCPACECVVSKVQFDCPDCGLFLG